MELHCREKRNVPHVRARNLLGCRKWNGKQHFLWIHWKNNFKTTVLEVKIKLQKIKINREKQGEIKSLGTETGLPSNLITPTPSFQCKLFYKFWHRIYFFGFAI